MITAGATEFPNNVIELIAARIPTYIDPDVQVFKRPLRKTDPTQSIGLFPSTKLADRSTTEFQSVEPTVKTYNIIIQTLVQDAVEDNAISIHSILSQRLWRMLYRDAALDAGLTALAVNADNSRERYQQRGVTITRYLSNEIVGSIFVYSSWIEFWFTTETVPVEA